MIQPVLRKSKGFRMLRLLISKYILILFWFGLLAIITRFVGRTRKERVYGYNGEVERYDPVFALVAFLPVILMAGGRSFYIGDTMTYCTFFEDMPTTFDRLISYVNSQARDRGFYFLSTVFKILVSQDPRVYFYVIAIIQGIILVWFFRKYSPSYITSIFLFVVSADYLSWMYNGIRQFLAVTIVLLAVPLVLKKKYIPAILIILAAALMHQTALIMIPIFFIAQGDAWNKKTIFFIFAVIFVIMFVDRFTDFLGDALADTQYKNVMNDIKEIGDDGTNVFRVLVYSVPAALSFIFRRQINHEGDPFIKLAANLTIVSSGLYVVSMFTSGIFMGRLPIFCSLFGYILIPWIIENFFAANLRGMANAAMVVLYCGYYYVQVGMIWGLF